ncbi:glycosyltransferase [candidate division KSB1 bacterium]
MKYFITGGGTGGHIYPALSIADAIIKKDPECFILFVGTERKADRQILKEKVIEGKLDVTFIRSSGFPRGMHPVKMLNFLWNISLGILCCFGLLGKYKPDVIVGTGGFGSFPLFFANLFFRKKTFIHEQNVLPGLANRVLGKLASKIGVSFRETLKFFPADKSVFTGYPLRWKSGDSDKVEAKRKLSFSPDKNIIFFFGGSLGARSINNALVEALPALLKEENIGIIHGAGKNVSSDYNAFEDTLTGLKKSGIDGSIPGKYLLQVYFNNINEVYAASDIVVARSGAGTVVELAAMGIPSILIPKSLIPGNHQYYNAKALADSGGAVILKEDVITVNNKKQECVDPEKLIQIIKDLIHNTQKLERMKESAGKIYIPDAVEKIYDEIAGLIK